jgi:hypothetical protein
MDTSFQNYLSEFLFQVDVVILAQLKRNLTCWCYPNVFGFINTVRSRGLQPYHREEVYVPQSPGELCWREHKLLVAPPMPDGSKGRGQMKCSPWSSRLGVGCGANDPTLKEFTGMKPWRRLRPTQGCNASKKEKCCKYEVFFLIFILCWQLYV